MYISKLGSSLILYFTLCRVHRSPLRVEWEHNERGIRLAGSGSQMLDQESHRTWESAGVETMLLGALKQRNKIIHLCYVHWLDFLVY